MGSTLSGEAASAKVEVHHVGVTSSHRGNSRSDPFSPQEVCSRRMAKECWVELASPKGGRGPTQIR